MPFADCTSNMNNSQIDNAKEIDVVMPMYHLIEYSDNYSETSGSLWQYYRNESNIIESESFKSKVKIIEKNHANGNTKKCWNSSTTKILN